MKRSGARRSIVAGGCAVACVAAAASVAQEQGEATAPAERPAASRIEQVTRSPAQRATVIVPQIDRDATLAASDEPPTAPVEQVGRVDDPAVAPPPGGSDRGDGRPPASAAIGGTDRCDVTATGADAPGACANPIEGRASQFRSPAPAALSPEQRLAIARQTGDTATLTREADRLARMPEGPPLTIVEQGIAAQTLKVPETPAPEAPKVEDISPAEVEALVHAVGTPTVP